MKKLPRVKCYSDGISINGLGSIRLSNVPKNLCYIAQCLATLGKKAPSILLTGLAFLSMKVKAQNCPELSCIQIYT